MQIQQKTDVRNKARRAQSLLGGPRFTSLFHTRCRGRPATHAHTQEEETRGRNKRRKEGGKKKTRQPPPRVLLHFVVPFPPLVSGSFHFGLSSLFCTSPLQGAVPSTASTTTKSSSSNSTSSLAPAHRQQQMLPTRGSVLSLYPPKGQERGRHLHAVGAHGTQQGVGRAGQGQKKPVVGHWDGGVVAVFHAGADLGGMGGIYTRACVSEFS